MKRLDQEIIKLMDPVFKKRNRILYQLVKNWSQIVGEKFAFTTTPSKISFSKEGIATLHITSSSHGVSIELFYHEAIIIEKIFIFLGVEAIRKLKIHTSALNGDIEREILIGGKNNYVFPQSLVTQMTKIKDLELFQALSNFSQVFVPKIIS